MKIFDCFQFSDENMLLEVRLNVLDKFIHKFIIAEADYTHDGRSKKLNFDINNFKKFKDKIEYIVVKNPPNLIVEKKDETRDQANERKILNCIKREHHQRNSLFKELEHANDNDIIILSDVDEIPNLQSLNLEQIKNEIVIFKQKMFYYKFNLCYEGFTWFGPKATKKKNFISPQWIRDIKTKKYPIWRFDTLFSKNKYINIRFIEDGGWHFTCIKNPEEVEKKLLSFAHHQDYEDSKMTLADLKNTMNEKKVLYDHKLDKSNLNKWNTNIKLKKIDDNELPLYLNENKNNYLQWLEK